MSGPAGSQYGHAKYIYPRREEDMRRLFPHERGIALVLGALCVALIDGRVRLVVIDVGKRRRRVAR